MGLLDDAIREHLDLKRRRGADPAEIARLEQEALGPVRREPAQAEADPPAGGSGSGGERRHEEDDPRHAHPADATHVLPPEERHDPPHGDPLLDRDDDRATLGGAAAPMPADAPAPARPAPEPHDAGADADDRHEPHDEPRGRAHDPRHDDIVHQPTTEYRVEDHHEDEDDAHEPRAGHEPRAPAADDDVLEETPDFLQETPEHDRLWFEQRPPRDFDFDG